MMALCDGRSLWQNPSMTRPIRLLNGLREMAGDYDAFILDLWGVLHDGQNPYPGVVDCLRQLKAAGKKRVILSNAPRRIAPVVARITEIGIPPDTYDGIMTSGEDTWEHMRLRGQSAAIGFYRNIGKYLYFIGPDRDLGLLEGIPMLRTDDMRKAELVLVTGVVEREDGLEAYDGQLRDLRKRNLPMVCANPDRVVRNGARMELCAGALAARYEDMGGTVLYHGKPFPEIYDHVFALLGHPDPQRTLAIGDSLRTDMGGAQLIGIDGLLVTDGIHAEEFGALGEASLDMMRITEACHAEGLSPRAAIRRLVW